MIAFSFVFPFIPLYVQALGVPDPTKAAQWSGWIAASTALTMAVAQPIWGNLADRFGRKPMVIRSMIAGSITLGLMGLATHPWHILVLRLLQGMLTGTVTASTALVATVVPKQRLGFALGLLQVAMFGGSSLGPLVGGIVADSFGFRASFGAACLLALAGGLTVITLVREDFTPPPATAARRGVIAGSRVLLALAGFPAII
ncbi:MAG: MFS transporter, partial [Deltaproteobacteria bacterium]|nr:MFS transporter [Deltaproteobacteria bacterium]